jgi:PAS domain S-box-containing protein
VIASHGELVQEIAALTRRLDEAREALRSLQEGAGGAIDGVPVQHPAAAAGVGDPRRSEPDLRHVLDNLFAFVGVLTPDGTLVQANRAPLEAAGIAAADVLGRKFWDCHWWSYAPEVQAELREAVARAARGEIVRYDVPVRMAGDTRMWIDFQLAPLRDEHGRITHLVPSAMDITARREAERELRDSEGRLRLALDAAQAGTFEIDLTPGVPPLVTDTVKGLFGFGAGDAPTLDDYLGRVHPADRDVVAAEIQRSIAHGVGHYVEYRLADPRGRERWIASRAEPLTDGSGRTTALRGALIDITARRHTEERLRESEERFRGTFENAAVGMAHVGLDGRWLRVNEKLAEITGYTHDELLARTFQEITHPDDVDPDLSLAQRVARGELATYTMEKRYIRKDGSQVFVNLTVSLSRGADGRPLHYISIVEDISERKRAELALATAHRQKDEFLAMLAHELRNPLAPIRVSAGILRAHGPADPLLARCRDVIDRQAAHMARLLDDLLDVSRLSRGRLTLQRAPVLLADVVAAAVETVRPVADEQGQELVLEGLDTAVVLDADAARLTQVFGNLLHNATKYSGRGSRIALSVSREHGEVVVRVRDQGIGIAPENLERIFELFAQADDAGTGARGGLGIGLSLVRRLVEMHGGRVEASSPGLGLGSEFAVRLPLVPGVHPAPGTAQPPAGRDVLAGRRVLVADDNADAADMLAALLELAGCQVRTAYDGPGAWRQADAFRPDVALLDLGMPGLDGYELCRRIRREPWGGGVAIVAITGWGQQEDRRRSAEAGFDLHLVKPVDADVLVQALREVRADTPGSGPR